MWRLLVDAFLLKQATERMYKDGSPGPHRTTCNRRVVRPFAKISTSRSRAHTARLASVIRHLRRENHESFSLLNFYTSIMIALSTFFTQGLTLPSQAVPRTAAPKMACVDEFSVSRVIKDVRVFDGDCKLSCNRCIQA